MNIMADRLSKPSKMIMLCFILFFFIFQVNPKLIPNVQQAICMTYMHIIRIKAAMIRMTKLMTMIMEASINIKNHVGGSMPTH